VQDLLDMDIGLMPLTDDEWARGKCGLKALQYMGLGIPAIVSPVGVNTEIVAHGVNGYHATDAASWHRAISLLSEPAQRIRLGRNARKTVEQRYSAEVAASKLAGLLRDVLR
jgi:glycosyltransferase involved in cell wall biosynthesis